MVITQSGQRTQNFSGFCLTLARRERLPNSVLAARFGRKTLAVCVCALAILCGCATHRPATCPSRRFDIEKDTFAYSNELVWEYAYDADGKWRGHARSPKPSYTLHCIVMARSARQFFENARFDPSLPVADEPTYRHLVHRVLARNPREPLSENEKVVIPGYADLRSFSEAHKTLLQAECGGAWQCYFQRGNWRMIFPFSRAQQARVADELVKHLKESGPVVIHLVCFPELSINHGVLIFDAQAEGKDIHFSTYDPNDPSKPTTITFDGATRTFLLPANAYFPGGPVDVYEIYHRWDY